MHYCHDLNQPQERSTRNILSRQSRYSRLPVRRMRQFTGSNSRQVLHPLCVLQTRNLDDVGHSAKRSLIYVILIRNELTFSQA